MGASPASSESSGADGTSSEKKEDIPAFTWRRKIYRRFRTNRFRAGCELRTIRRRIEEAEGRQPPAQILCLRSTLLILYIVNISYSEDRKQIMYFSIRNVHLKIYKVMTLTPLHRLWVPLYIFM